MENLKMPALMSGWTIEEELGEGSYGTVYSIRQGDVINALKIIPFPKDESELRKQLRDLKDENAVNEYFRSQAMDCLKEEEIQKKLQNCENIVRIHDAAVEPKEGEIGWNVFIRMELLTELREYQDMQDMRESDVLAMAVQLCNALEACEKEEILHRDIKPENILVADDGTFKLGDFGLARRREVSVGSFSLKGTYDYMSPEIYHGKRYGKKADIYSLGMVLYKMLNKNRGPFIPLDKQIITYRDKEEAIEKRMRGDMMPAPSEASPEMANIILRLCAHDENQRFACAADAKKALIQHSKGKYRIVELKNPEDEKSEDAAHKKASGSRGKRIAIIAVAVLAAAAIGVFALVQSYMSNTDNGGSSSIGSHSVNYIIENESFGTGLACSLDSNGLLTVTGAGEMYGRNQGEYRFPWDDYSNEIKQISFEADSSIARNAFDGLKNLEKADISGNVESIVFSAFTNCPSLEEVVLPNTVREIGNNAFSGCTNLSRINLSSNVDVGRAAFKGTAYLKRIMDENNGFGIVNGVLCEYSGNASEVVIPDGVTRIESAAFFGNTAITSVIIPESVTEISQGAFMSCTSLSNVVIENPDCKYYPDSFSNTAWNNY